jgi:excisionase family DNA binding protein
MADLSVREAAERARTSDRTVRRWIAEGKLTGTSTADGWTVAESDLTAFLDVRPTKRRTWRLSCATSNARTSNLPASSARYSNGWCSLRSGSAASRGRTRPAPAPVAA